KFEFLKTSPTNYNYPLRYQGYQPTSEDQELYAMRSCKVIAYPRASSIEEDDIYKKKAAKAPTPATKPPTLREEAAPVNSGGLEGLT
ncbi:hypothetical protein JQN64_26580, partial [Escherichia coli]|nr:hypothetical protein [Escherichia coli]